MTPPRIYFDHAATTPLRPEVLEAMAPALTGTYGNPSSVHGAGRAARALIDTARDQLAETLNCRPREIVFTGGGSESDNLALRGVTRRLNRRGGHLIVSSIEHEAVLETARDLAQQGFELTELPADPAGRILPDRLREALRPETILVSVMMANNEVGTIQPIQELAAATHAGSRAVFHTDATQALGKLKVDVQELGVDLLTISAHKIYGPKGVGALFARHGTGLDPIITGGGQERTRRSGTENVPGIVGFGVAAQLAEAEREREMARQAELAADLARRILAGVSDAIPTGAPAGERLANFCTFAFPSAEGELLLLRLDRCGIYGSAGSACTSGSLAPSHVLLAMGLSPQLASAHLRLTLGRSTTEAEVERAGEMICREVAALRQGAFAV
ncbi:MAG TPA: cysteine desulfurase family protein [Candidatus Micrarchaeaceae archaeon]|nr:cysteine desulfurase family protein [Candidatus Micrarchaeaceae archaeon]